ncbi:MAG: CpsB/CapC family capsule biosynthesis tyrosine phosphatase [Longimicrobiales bacterium]|nr:CpsB/CapC family capsule biosynthesis tyrosine phosphatase [Longimicrobiales bacterium]
MADLVDIHSHLVPGVDDGAQDVPAVLHSVERMAGAGIRTILTTPHIRASLTQAPDRLEARLAEVSEAFQRAASAVAETPPDMEFRRGHEILLDVPEADFSDERIRMAGTSFVLVEWPRLQIPPGTTRVLARIREQGYRPIVAHPERYFGMLDQPGLAEGWRDVGAYLQVNYGSLDGRYGREPHRAALELLERGLVDYLASDFHGRAGMKIYKEEAWNVLQERGAGEALQMLCRANPSRILEDLEPLPVPALPPASKLMDRIRDMVGRRGRPSEEQGR